jgi:hypothetical protein
MRAHTTATPGSQGRTAVALLALTAFGCTTIRAPASAIGGTIPVEEGVARPQAELWLESGRPISPAEQARASAEAHQALRQALAGRRLDEGDQLLVVRAQGVSRTDSHRNDQKAAVAGIVVGAVVIVAAVVVAVVAGKGGGGGKGSGGGAKVSGGGRPGGWSSAAGGARVAGAAGSVRPSPPRVAGGAVRPAPPASRPRPPSGGWSPAPVASRHHHHHDGSVNVWVGWSADWRVPLAPDAEVVDGPLLAEGPSPSGWYAPLRSEVLEAPEAPEAEEAAPATAIVLPPLPPLGVEERGFFDGDLTRLELTLVDRATGAPRWVKRVEKDVDPRDAKAVKALLDRALDEQKGWMRVGAPGV